MTRKIKQYLYSRWLKPLWNLIKYGVLGVFHIWMGIKKIIRLFGIPAIIVDYHMHKRKDIKSIFISSFEASSFKANPLFNNREDIPHFDHVVYIVPHWKLFGTYTIATQSNIILRDVSWRRNIGKWSNPYTYKLLPKKIEKIKITVGVLTGNDTDKNYHHWLITLISKYSILKKSWIKIDKYIVDTNASFHKEWLKALGLSEDQIISADFQKNYQFDNIVCTSDSTIYGNIQPWVKDLLWETFIIPANKTPANTKIYIKRISNRKIANEQEFEDYISAQGFEIHSMEGLTIKKQAELFHQASIIISPHGAGLTNIVFCRPGTKIIEIFHSQTIFGHYYLMAGSLGMDYYPVLGKIKPDPKVIEMDQDIIVNIKDINTILENFH